MKKKIILLLALLSSINAYNFDSYILKDGNFTEIHLLGLYSNMEEDKLYPIVYDQCINIYNYTKTLCYENHVSFSIFPGRNRKDGRFYMKSEKIIL